MSVEFNFPSSLDETTKRSIMSKIGISYNTKHDFSLIIDDGYNLAAEVDNFCELINTLIASDDFDVVFLDEVGGNCVLRRNASTSNRNELFVHPPPFVASHKVKNSKAIVVANNGSSSGRYFIYFGLVVFFVATGIYAYKRTTRKSKK